MMESTESYSDGQWHTVVANRLKQDGLVKVDGVTGTGKKTLTSRIPRERKIHLSTHNCGLLQSQREDPQVTSRSYPYRTTSTSEDTGENTDTRE